MDCLSLSEFDISEHFTSLFIILNELSTGSSIGLMSSIKSSDGVVGSKSIGVVAMVPTLIILLESYPSR